MVSYRYKDEDIKSILKKTVFKNMDSIQLARARI